MSVAVDQAQTMRHQSDAATARRQARNGWLVVGGVLVVAVLIDVVHSTDDGKRKRKR